MAVNPDSLLSHPVSRTSSSFQPASMQARRAACTHVTMERLYGEHTICSVCLRLPPFGWVYLCDQDKGVPLSIGIPNTQDAGLIGENAKAEGAIDKGVKHGSLVDELLELGDIDKEAYAPPPPHLSLSVEKAIKEGQYTPELVLKLRAQRQKVLHVIAAAEEHIKKHPEHSADDPWALPDPVPQPVNIKPSPLPDLDKVQDLLLQSDLAGAPSVKPRMFPHCKLRACHACRPMFRDRTWLRLGSILLERNVSPTINFNTDSRPISDARIVCSLGLRKYKLPTPSVQTVEDAKSYQSSSVGLTSTDAYSQPPSRFLDTETPACEKTDPESKGFRKSLKRAFRGMLNKRRASTSTGSIWEKQAQENGTSESVDFDMESFRQLSEELLQEASSVALPGHDGMDGLGAEKGEIEVEEGVAVTEESVDMGTADIIMAV